MAKKKIVQFYKDDLEEIQKDLAALYVLEKELTRKIRMMNPLYYGLPDLLFPKNYLPGTLDDNGDIQRKRMLNDETEEEFKRRRREALDDFVKNYLYLQKDGVQQQINLIQPQLDLLFDVFYGYTNRAIAWKCLHPDNYIFTKDGFKKIIDVNIGDCVLNPKGNWVRVVDIGRKHHTGPLISIKLKGWPASFRFTPDHEILTTKGWKKAEELSLYDKLVFPCEIDFTYQIEAEAFRTILSGGIWHKSVAMPDLQRYWLSLSSLGIKPYMSKDLKDIYGAKGHFNEYIGKIEEIKIDPQYYDGVVCDIEVDGEYPGFCSPFLVQHNCRGGGGSLVAAILIFLLLIYRQKSVLDLAGSREQAKIVYNYAKGFLDCFPLLKKELVDGEPLMSETRFKTGVKLYVIASSDKQARGKHEPCLFIDEAAQKDRSLDDIFWDVMNGTLNIKDGYVVLWSTFHVPVGFFQEVWDTAEDRGFRRYKWSVFQCLKRCTAGMEFATKSDPNALEYCRTKCYLTYRVDDVDDQGNVIGYTFEGCNGQARESSGWLDRDTVIATKKVNEGSERFRVEFECKRPEFSGPIFGLGYIEDAVVPALPKEKDGQGIVGIDWGYATEGAIVLVKDFGEFVGVIDGYCLSQKSLREWIDILERWQRDFSDEPLIVYADDSHKMNNVELEQYGFDVVPVNFHPKARNYLEGNLLKYFVYKKIKISSHLGRIIWQLKNYRKNPTTGHIIKKDDHGPDALEVAFLHFPFMEKYYHEIKEALKKQFRDDDEPEVEILM